MDTIAFTESMTPKETFATVITIKRVLLSPTSRRTSALQDLRISMQHALVVRVSSGPWRSHMEGTQSVGLSRSLVIRLIVVVNVEVLSSVDDGDILRFNSL